MCGTFNHIPDTASMSARKAYYKNMYWKTYSIPSCTTFHGRCIVNSGQCSIINKKTICGPVSCSGMFKCHRRHCIFLSLVCNGAYDSDRGEDEQMCSIFTCPGFLKCRGENKCVSTSEICDTRVNSFYSKDDELDCHDCPDNCECTGYVMSCHSNNYLHIGHKYNSDEVLHAKGLLIKGIQNRLIPLKFKFTGLLLLNMSLCELKSVDMFSDDIVSSVLSIANFSHNYLLSIHFLKAKSFLQFFFLDLSFNSLYIFHYGKSSSLKYLSVLFLMGNNLKEIIVTSDEYRLFLINLQFVDYYPNLVILVYPAISHELVIKVSDALFCCIFPENIKCLLTENRIQCYGLLEANISRIIIYCLSFASLLISSVVMCKYAINISSIEKSIRVKKYYLIVLINQLISSILSSLYLTALSFAEITKVNLIYFKNSSICGSLNGIIYISLTSTTIFKACVISFESLTILFPFKHQCFKLQWIGPLTAFVWIAITSTYLLFTYL